MKINGLSSELLKLISGEIKEAAGKRSTAAKRAHKTEGISIEITAELSLLEPETVSREKVEEIKKAIKEGRYEINPHRISEAIINEILGE